MDTLYHFCQGESHIEEDKPCQDCAFSETYSDFSVAIVCDGHGGGRYFRSHIGANYAKDVTLEAVKEFVASTSDSRYKRILGKPLFEGIGFTQYDLSETPQTSVEFQQQADEIHSAFNHLFSFIVTEWRNRINQHAKNNDLNDWEIEHVKEKYKEDFLMKRFDEDASFEKTYGCTLMVYVQTKDYWFAFHIGDGKCVRLQVNDGHASFDQPIPWDEACFLNGTTSLCNTQAVEKFRYCYQGDGNFPTAMFLASDGVDDTFVNDENLNNFYANLYKSIAKGKEGALKELKEVLPILSKRRSKDDMSVACVFDENTLQNNILPITEYQMNLVDRKRLAVTEKARKLLEKIQSYGNFNDLSPKEQIEYKYAEKDLIKATEEEKKLSSKYGGFKGRCSYLKKRLSEGSDEQVEENDSFNPESIEISELENPLPSNNENSVAESDNNESN